MDKINIRINNNLPNLMLSLKQIPSSFISRDILAPTINDAGTTF